MSEPRLDDIGACVFDAYGTLFDVHAPAQRLRAELGDKAEPLSNLWRTKQLEYTWLRSLMGTHADFWQVTSEALDHALDAVGSADPDLRRRLLEDYFTLTAYPDAASALSRLHTAGLPNAILSNGTPEMLKAAVDHAGLTDLLKAVLSIEEVGVYKPDPRTYQLAVDRLGVPAGRICFVSTNGWDAAGAAAFGFRVVWLNRFARTRERLPAVPEAEISRLDELLPIVGV